MKSIERRQTRQSMTRYECPNCSIHVLGKPGLSLGCMNCCSYMRRRKSVTRPRGADRELVTFHRTNQRRNSHVKN
jgi:hypothetical protein